MRYMYVLVFFDLPVTTKSGQRDANRFRKSLLNKGFFMLQYSIYAKICRGEKVETIERYLKYIVPSRGHVRVLQITDRQFANMQILIGEKEKTEKNSPKQLVLL